MSARLTPAQRYQRSVKRKPAKSEHVLQAAIVKACRGYWAGLVGDRFTAFPNGWYAGGSTAVQRAIQGRKLKDEGMRPGMPDLLFWAPGGRMLFMEVKLGTGGVVSPVQKEVHESLLACGHQVVVCRDLTEALRTIEGFYGRKEAV